MVDLLSGIFGLIGVLVGGGITFFLQRHFIAKEQKIDLENNIASGIHKLRKILDQILILSININDTLPEEGDEYVWHHMVNINGLDNRQIDFTSKELFAFKGDNADLVRDNLYILAEKRNAIIATYINYNIIRDDLHVHLEPFQTYTHGKAYQRLKINSKKNPEIFIKINTVDNSARQIISNICDFIKVAEQTLLYVNQSINSSLGESRAKLYRISDLDEGKYHIDMSKFPNALD